MNCRACGAANRADATFCIACGTKLAAACAQCGRELPAGARFCDGCGAAQAAGTARLATEPDPRARVPSHLAARILRDRAALEGEHRIVTVLFIDAVGSVATTGEMQPEQHHRIVHRSTELMIESVNRFEGTVTQFRGDGIMAIFGAPIAHEDSARRAAAAAIDMRDALMAYERELGASGSKGFAYRIGLNTGRVIVGSIGNDLTMDYTAVGDTVNLAARMEGAAPPWAIYATEQTHRAIMDYFELTDAGTIDVKGKSEPVRAFAIDRELPSRTRLGAAVARGLTPYVGRSADLAVLHEAYELARSGSGQAIFISGEAGIGKSRLLLEFRRNLAESARWVEGRCLSYGRDLPYHPVREIVRQVLRVDERASEAEICDAIEATRVEWGGSGERSLQYLGYLLGTGDEKERIAAADPAERRMAIHDALQMLIARASVAAPIVAVLEDLHWIDEQSEKALGAIADAAASLRVLIIVTHRPDYTYRLGDRTFFTRRALRSLAEEESASMVTSVLDASGVPADLQELVIARAEGNPFYIEEVVRSVLESGVLRPVEGGGYELTKTLDEIEIPDTVQGVILSRLDRLSWETKEVVQHAAVVGREFSVAIVERVISPEIQATSALDELRAMELIYDTTLFPERRCTFKHALTHEVALSTLLAERKRAMHRSVALAIESLTEGRPQDQYEALAYHYYEAEEWEQALTYARHAAERARDLYAPRAAIEQLTRAIEALARLRRVADPALYRARGSAYEAIGEFDHARADHETAVAAARDSGDLNAEWQACADLGMLWAGRDYQRTGEYFQKAADLADVSGDRKLIGHSLNRLANWKLNLEEPGEARELHDRALAIFEDLGDARGVAETVDFLTMTYVLGCDTLAATEMRVRALSLFEELGDKHGIVMQLSLQALEAPNIRSRAVVTVCADPLAVTANSEQARTLARQVGWRSGEAFAEVMASTSLLERGHYAAALESAEAALRIAEEIGHRQWESGAHWALGMTYRDIAAPTEARYHLERALSRALEIGSMHWTRTTGGDLIAHCAESGDLARAHAVLATMPRVEDPPVTLAGRCMYGGRLVLAIEEGDGREALRLIEALRATALHLDGNGLSALPWLALQWGRSLQLLGRGAEARGELARAVDVAGDQGSLTTVWRLQAFLGELLAAQGDAEGARATYGAALAIIHRLADSLHNDELARRYLASPAVRKVEDGAT